MRLVWLVVEHCDVRHQLVPDRAGFLVRVELRLATLLLMWRAQCLAVRLDQERHSVLESQVHELDPCPRRRQRVDGVREVRVIAEKWVTVSDVLAHKMSKALYAEPLLNSFV